MPPLPVARAVVISLCLFAFGVFVTACIDDEGGVDAAVDAMDAALDANTDAHVDADANVDANVDADLAYTRLSETGLYEDIATRTLSADVLAYTVRHELWADTAAKDRFLRLPVGTRIDTSDPDRWVFPVGTQAFKGFTRDGVLVETRLLEKRGPGDWVQLTFVWDGEDAYAETEGRENAGGTPHDVPDQAACMDCHRGAADMLLGVSTVQLVELDRIRSQFSVPVTQLPVPGDDIERAALGYLHANCGHCHSDDHPLAEHLSIRLRLPAALTDASEAPALTTCVEKVAGHAIEGTTRVLIPSDAARSQLYVRPTLRGVYGMPPPDRGTETPDPHGAELLRAWIDAMPEEGL